MHFDELPEELSAFLILPLVSIHDLLQLSQTSKSWNRRVTSALERSHPISRLILQSDTTTRFPIHSLNEWTRFVKMEKQWFEWLNSWGGFVSLESWKTAPNRISIHALSSNHTCEAYEERPLNYRRSSVSRGRSISPGRMSSARGRTVSRAASPQRNRSISPISTQSHEERSTVASELSTRPRFTSPDRSVTRCIPCTFALANDVCLQSSWLSKSETKDTMAMVATWKDLVDFMHKLAVGLCGHFRHEAQNASDRAAMAAVAVTAANERFTQGDSSHSSSDKSPVFKGTKSSSFPAFTSASLAAAAANQAQLGSTYHQVQVAFMIECLLAFQLDQLHRRRKAVDQRERTLLDICDHPSWDRSNSHYWEIREWCYDSFQEIGLLDLLFNWTLGHLLELGIELAATLCLRNGLLEIYLKWLFHPDNKPAFVQKYLFRFIDALKVQTASSSHCSTQVFNLTSHLKLVSHILQYIMEMDLLESRYFYVNSMLYLFQAFPQFIDSDSLQHVFRHIIRHLPLENLPLQMRVDLALKCKSVLKLVAGLIQDEGPISTTSKLQPFSSPPRPHAFLPQLNLPTPLLGMDASQIGGDSIPPRSYTPCWTKQQFMQMCQNTFDEFDHLKASSNSVAVAVPIPGHIGTGHWQDMLLSGDRVILIDNFMRLVWADEWPHPQS